MKKRFARILIFILLIGFSACPANGFSTDHADSPFMRKIPLSVTFDGQTYSIGIVQIGKTTLAEMEKMMESAGIYEGPLASGATFVYTKTKMRSSYGANESEDLCLSLRFDSKSFFFTDNVLTSAYISLYKTEFTTAEGLTCPNHDHPNQHWFEEMVSVYGADFETEPVTDPDVCGTQYYYDGIMFKGTYGCGETYIDDPPIDTTESLSDVFYSIGYPDSRPKQ